MATTTMTMIVTRSKTTGPITMIRTTGKRRIRRIRRRTTTTRMMMKKMTIMTTMTMTTMTMTTVPMAAALTTTRMRSGIRTTAAGNPSLADHPSPDRNRSLEIPQNPLDLRRQSPLLPKRPRLVATVVNTVVTAVVVHGVAEAVAVSKAAVSNASVAIAFLVLWRSAVVLNVSTVAAW
jgi:hypothetical protein